MRLLLLTDEMEVGGSQRQIVQIATSLDRERYEPVVAYFRNRSFLVDELREAGVPVVEIRKRGRIDLPFTARLARFVAGGGFQVMHCFDFTAELWGAVAHAMLPAARRPALVTTVQGTFDWYAAWQWKAKRWVTRRSTRVIANSAAGRDYACRRMALPEGAIDLVNNGVPDRGAAVPRPLEGPGRIRALFVGRLVEVKNLPVLLRAMARLRAHGSPVQLRIAGDGPLRTAIEAQVAALGLGDDVELLGQRSDIAGLMADSDVIVLPSHSEGLSNVILEAMMAGRPVVASAVGGTPELVADGRTGVLFPSDDDAALAAALDRLAADPGMRRAMGAAARATALRDHSMSAMVAAMESHYEHCATHQP